MASSAGNSIALFVVISWPLVAIWFYRTRSIQVATLWVILGGVMFLPVRTQLDFPLIPPLGKHSIPVISALLGLWLIKGQVISLKMDYIWGRRLLFIFLFSPIITVFLNGKPINVGGHFLPGLTMHDALSVVVNQWLFIISLLLGRQFFRTYEQQLLVFKVLVTTGLFYSLFMLYEIRMSPQLHSWLYGYFPHSFAQQRRGMGFRPVVFMGHGLLVAFFVMIIGLAATTLWRNGEKVRKLPPAMVSYYLLGVLVLCKSMASLIYGVYAFILISFINVKVQLRLAVIVVMLALLYPTMSILNIFPHQQVVNLAKIVDEDRADSLLFRFEQESQLLEHGARRFFFGWGGWGRNRVHDDETGEGTSVTDGRWIITFGQFGWLGFFAEFGLLAMTVLRAYTASKIVTNKKELNLLAAHAILVSLIALDQLPNASLAPWLWLLVGVLLGRSEDIIGQNSIAKRKVKGGMSV